MLLAIKDKKDDAGRGELLLLRRLREREREREKSASAEKTGRHFKRGEVQI